MIQKDVGLCSFLEWILGYFLVQPKVAIWDSMIYELQFKNTCLRIQEHLHKTKAIQIQVCINIHQGPKLHFLFPSNLLPRKKGKCSLQIQMKTELSPWLGIMICNQPFSGWSCGIWETVISQQKIRNKWKLNQGSTPFTESVLANSHH